MLLLAYVAFAVLSGEEHTFSDVEPPDAHRLAPAEIGERRSFAPACLSQSHLSTSSLCAYFCAPSSLCLRTDVDIQARHSRPLLTAF